jgi:hypothetical protein
MVRTQLYLDDAAHARLRELADRQGKSESELVRDAINQVYMKPVNRELLAALDKAAGSWKNRDDLGDTLEYVRRLRKGTGRRKRLVR